MLIEVRSLQVKKSSWIFEVIGQYEKKISFFNPIQFKFLKSEKDFLKSVTERDFVLICDERGESPDSKKFASQLKSYLESGKKNLYVLVGGPFGLSDEVRARADFSLSLSHFIMNQEVAIVVLMEQIFRAMTINANHPYHNE